MNPNAKCTTNIQHNKKGNGIQSKLIKWLKPSKCFDQVENEDTGQVNEVNDEDIDEVDVVEGLNLKKLWNSNFLDNLLGVTFYNLVGNLYRLSLWILHFITVI